MSRDLEARVRRANLLSRDEQLEMLFGEDLSPQLLGRIRDLEEGRMTETRRDEQYEIDEPVVDAKAGGGSAGTHTGARKPRRWRLAPGLAFVLALLVGVPVGIFLTDSRPQPVKAAEAYLDARNAYDADRARELVAEDFTTTENPDGFRDAEGMETAFQQHEAYGFRYDDIACRATNEADGKVWVTCEYSWTTELHRITNHPATPESLRFVVNGDGLIQGVIRSRGDFAPWWDPWLEFLRAEHPDFHNVVVRALSNDPEATRDLATGLPEHLDLYRAWVASQEG